MLVLVVGGTGGLGQHVVTELVARRHRVRVLSRQPRSEVSGAPGVEKVRGDVASGDGVVAAMRGVHAVVNTVNASRGAEQVMVAGTCRLLEAAATAGVHHVVEIGIVGAEAIAPVVPYYRVKLAQERVLRDGGVPWSLLRATQFHDFVGEILSGLARLPVMLTPAIQLQPVDRREVATALVDAVDAGPAGRLPDFAGPQALPLTDLARIWLEAQGLHQRSVAIPLPTRFGRRLREGALCSPEQAVGRTTFSDWAADQVQGDAHA
jgi:uncharacterized protein YbjT (DUF2867 family)